MANHDKHDKHDKQHEREEQDKKERRSGKYSVSMHGVNHTFKTPHEAAAMVNFLNGGNKYDPKALEDVFAQPEEDEERRKLIEQEKKDSEAQANKARLEALDPHERDALEKNGKRSGVHPHEAGDQEPQPAQGPSAGAVKGQTPQAAEQARDNKHPSRHATAARTGHTKRGRPKAKKPARRR
jgi:hypothetical protein